MRELNQELFTEPQVANPKTGNVDPRMPSMQNRNKLTEFHREVLSQIDGLRRRIKELENNNEQSQNRFNHFAKTVISKMERLQGAYQKVEDTVKTHSSDVANKFSTIVSKVSEKKQAEAKIQEMIDRHQQVIVTFEARLKQLQKFNSEQEMKILNYQSIMNEMRQEIIKLKRL